MADGFKVQLKTTLEVTCTCLLCCAAYINLRAVKTCKLPNSRLSSLCWLLLTSLLICGSHLSLPYSSPYFAASATCSEEKGGQRALPIISPRLCPHSPGLPLLLAPSSSPPCQTSPALCLLFLKLQPHILASSRVPDCNTDFVYCILVAQGLLCLPWGFTL